MTAIAENDLRGVKSALEAGAPIGYAWNKPPYDTPIMRAYGRVEIMRVLLAAGATVSDDHVEGRSPFDYVDAKVKPEVLQLLLEARPPANVVFRAMRKPGVPRPEFGRFYEWNVRVGARSFEWKRGWSTAGACGGRRPRTLPSARFPSW